MSFLETIALKDISEIVKMAGLVAGGLWAAWTFQKLQKVRAAELENNQKLTEIQKLRTEQEELRMRLLRQQPQLAMDLHVTETASPIASYKSFLCITVTLNNEGEQNLDVQFGSSALTIGRTVFHKNGKQTMAVQRFAAPILRISAMSRNFFAIEYSESAKSAKWHLPYYRLSNLPATSSSFMPCTANARSTANAPTKNQSSSTPSSKQFVLQQEIRVHPYKPHKLHEFVRAPDMFGIIRVKLHTPC